MPPSAVASLFPRGETARTIDPETATPDEIAKALAYGYSTGLTGVDQERNELIKHILWGTLGGLALLILGVRLLERYKAWMRLMSTVSAPAAKQDYWKKNRYGIWKLRKYFLYAPLCSKRHNREIRLSRAGNMGTIPSRLHTFILVAYAASNLAYCVWLNYKVEDRFALAADLRGRAGVMAVYNMIAMVIFAGRNNPLIPILQISFDTYNLFHRWIGRIVVIESIVHTGAWFYNRKAAEGWDGTFTSLFTDPFYTTGIVAAVAMLVILITSISPVRHAFYETFLNGHIIMGFLAILGAMLHCELNDLPQTPLTRAILIIWLLERLARVARLVYVNYSTRGWTSASIQAMPGDACKVTVHLPKHVNIRPGTHAYLRFWGVNAWESHPFSIAWAEDRLVDASPRGLGDEKAMAAVAQTDVSFIIHAQTGMTRRLFELAVRQGEKPVPIRAALEGPYAGHHSLDSYGHVVLFAGSSGITHQLPYIRHLIAGYKNSSVATRKITLVWIIREPEHLEWIRGWMDSVLHMPGRRDILLVKVYVTRPHNPKEITSPSATVQMYPGRPDVTTLLEEEVSKQVGAMCVTVCGPGGLADNVRHAVRGVQHRSSVSFIEESFTW